MRSGDRLQRLKRVGLEALGRAGVSRLIERSRWRRRRLVILCYHGVSLEREHRWRPLLYVDRKHFRRRMELLREGGYRVLPLQEALERLDEGALPEKSVALTFDDGFHDFHERAYPVVRAFGYPCTVYLSTYYCLNGRPVFPLACDYVLWQAERSSLPGVEVAGTTVDLDLGTEASRRAATAELVDLADRAGLEDPAKQELVERLAARLGVDYAAIRERRIAHLMRPGQVEELAGRGVDFQLHTHRHRSPPREDEYREEIRTNRRAITDLTGRVPQHFCYPSGAARPEFAPWLAREGVASAVTDRPGAVSATTDRMFVPRFLDHSELSEAEFLASVSGLADWLPRRYR